MSLKCSVLKSGFCELTQGFGGYNNHRGLDLVDQGYTIGDIVSYDNGTVVMVTNGYRNGQGEGVNWAYGNFVKILHDDGTVCLYAHMEYTSVSYNQRVSKGQLLGRIGNSGNSNGGHLHWEYWERNDYNSNIDPMPYLDYILPNPTVRDTTVNQIEVIVDDLNVRTGAGTEYESKGACIKGFYSYLDNVFVENMQWYKIADNRWVALYNNSLKWLASDSYNVPIEEPIAEQPVITEPTTPTENDDIKPVEEDKQEDNTNNTEIIKEPRNSFKSIIKYIIEKILEYLKERYNNDKKNFKGN